MPITMHDPDKSCPECAEAQAYYFDKDEGSKIKRCYTCDNCGCEWSRWIEWTER